MAMSNDQWDNVGEAHAIGADYPTCPKCLTNYQVYCMECETHSVNCHCTTLEFYCSDCNEDFEWNLETGNTVVYYDGIKDLEKIRDAFSGIGNNASAFNHNLEELIDDMDEILDIEIVDESAGIREARDKNATHGIMHSPHVCPNCYKNEIHTCTTQAGLIIEWGGDDGYERELKCNCTPPRVYICSKCEVERDEHNGPWRHSALTSIGQTANIVCEAVKATLTMFGSKEDEDGAPTCIHEPQPSYFCGGCRVTRSVPTAAWQAIEGYKDAQAARRMEKGLPPVATSNHDRYVVGTSNCADCGQGPGEAHNAACLSRPHPRSGANGATSATKSTPVPYTTNPSKYGTNGGGWDDWDDYKWMGLSKCRHYGEPVKLPNGVVIHCSSLWDQRKEASDYPDRGLYFDWSWKPDWRSELSLWPDFGIPTNMAATAKAIKEYYDYAAKGEHIELGCIGGHGRTGTALACMVVIADYEEDLRNPGTTHKGKDAGLWVKKNYCKEAIESAGQWWYIDWFAAWLKGEPLPDRPIVSARVTIPAVPICTISQHYNQYLANPKATKCTARKDDCKMFETDVKKFVEGKVETHVMKAALELKSLSDFHNIDGYAVPRTKIGEASHNRNDRECMCDYCRYRKKGMLAFLDPILVKEVYIQTPSGIIKTDVTPEFEPKPPQSMGTSLGHRIGEYVWTLHENEQRWVWHVERRAKSRYIRENAERNKKKNEAAGNVITKTTGGVRIEGIGSGSIKVKDMQELAQASEGVYPPRSGKRNKKNPNRDGGRRRSSKRRR